MLNIHNKLFLFSTIICLSLFSSSCSTTYFGNGDSSWKIAKTDESVDVNRSPYGYFLAGIYARSKRDYSIAADYFIKAFEQDASNDTLLKSAYNLLAAEGRIDEAYKYAELSNRKQPSQGIPAIIICAYHSKRGDYDKGLEALNSKLSSRYQKFFIPLIKSWLFVGKNDKENALKEIETLRDNAQLQSFYHFHAGMIEDLIGDIEEAKQHYQISLLGDEGNSLRSLQIVVNFYLRNNMKDDALKLVAGFIEKHPNSLAVKNIYKKIQNTEKAPDRIVKTASNGIAEAMFSIAATMNFGGVSDISLLFSHMAVYLNNNLDLAYVLLAEIMEERGDYEKAIETYGLINKQSPVYISSQLRTAINYGELDKGKKAIAMLYKVIDRYPELNSAYSDLGDLLRIKGDYKGAIKAYSKVIENINDNSKKYWVLYYARGVSYERIKKWKKAEQDFIKSLELEPDNPLVLNYLGYSWIEQGKKINEALEMIRKAYEQKPFDGYIVDSLGWAYYKAGEYQKALTYLEEALDLEPSNSVINDHLGDVYWKLGRQNEAYFQWKKAIDLDSELEEGGKEKIMKKIKEGLIE